MRFFDQGALFPMVNSFSALACFLTGVLPAVIYFTAGISSPPIYHEIEKHIVYQGGTEELQKACGPDPKSAYLSLLKDHDLPKHAKDWQNEPSMGHSESVILEQKQMR